MNRFYDNPIIYQDTVVAVNHYGNNIVVTKVENVKECLLEKVINIICKNNSSIKINIISYSQKNETLYFYAEKKLDISEYEKTFGQNIVFNSKIKDCSLFAEYCKKVLSKEIKPKENEISCYDLYLFFRDIYLKNKGKMDNLICKINDALSNESQDIKCSKITSEKKEDSEFIVFKMSYAKSMYKWDYFELSIALDICDNKISNAYVSKAKNLPWDIKQENIFVVITPFLSKIYEVVNEYNKDTQKVQYASCCIYPSIYLNINIDDYFSMSLQQGHTLFPVAAINIMIDKFSVEANDFNVNSICIGKEQDILKKCYVNPFLFTDNYKQKSFSIKKENFFYRLFNK